MVLLVTSASGANGAGYGKLLAFDKGGELLGPFSADERIVDPRGLGVKGALLLVNSGSNRILVLDGKGRVVGDSGAVADLNPGGGNFGPDRRYYVGSRAARTIIAFAPTLDRPGEPVLPSAVVPFPRGFAFAQPGTLFLASGIGPAGNQTSGPQIENGGRPVEHFWGKSCEGVRVKRTPRAKVRRSEQGKRRSCLRMVLAFSGSEGDNTILAFGPKRKLNSTWKVEDPELSPLDLAIAPDGNVVVSSEHPFGALDATTTIREYDRTDGRLVRVLTPDRGIGFRKPRGLRFGPDGELYCVAQDEVVLFDFVSGTCKGALVRLPGLNGQAVILFG